MPQLSLPIMKAFSDLTTAKCHQLATRHRPLHNPQAPCGKEELRSSSNKQKSKPQNTHKKAQISLWGVCKDAYSISDKLCCLQAFSAALGRRRETTWKVLWQHTLMTSHFRRKRKMLKAEDSTAWNKIKVIKQSRQRTIVSLFCS